MRASVAHAAPLREASTGSWLVTASQVARLLSRACFYALVLAMPLRARLELELRGPANVWDEYTSFFLYWPDIAFFGVIGFWSLSLALQRRTVWFGPPLLRWTAVAFLWVVWLTGAFSIDSELAAYNALRVSGAVLLALYVCNEFESLTQVLPAIVLLVVTQGGIALLQFFQQRGLGLTWLSESPYQDPFFPGASIVWTPGHDPLLRAYGLTEHPNILGGILAASLLLLLPLALSRRRAMLVFVTTVFAVGAAALLATFSRGAMLGATTGAVVMFGLLAYRRLWSQALRWLLPCLVASIVCLSIAASYAPYLGARFDPQPSTTETTEARSIHEREDLIRLAWQVFEAHPVTGVGTGALASHLARTFTDEPYANQPVHMVLLTIATETGAAGAALFVALVAAPWLLLWRRRRALMPEVIATAGAVFAVTVVGLFDYYPWGLQQGRLLTWLTLGLFALAYRHAFLDSKPAATPEAMGVSSKAGS